MKPKLSFRGNLPDGLKEKIHISTKNGKTGYKITKFQIIGDEPGTDDCELLSKVYSKDPGSTLNAEVNFTEPDLLAIAFFKDRNDTTYQSGNTHIIFDNEVFNQDIYISGKDVTGNANSTNYYIELERVALSESQATQLTLKSLRSIAGQ